MVNKINIVGEEDRAGSLRNEQRLADGDGARVG